MKNMNVKTYLDQFDVVGKSGEIDCDYLSTLLYMAILNKFKINLNNKEYQYFREYQERVFNLVENLRELSEHNIDLILTYINKVNHYLVDIVIMSWCLPRIDNYLSKKIYQRHYGQNIQKFNVKICNLITHHVVKNFCIETLTKINNVPAHCIDYIWYYMKNISLELVFYNRENGNYIGIDILDQHHPTDEEITQIGLNIPYLLDLGLASVIYKDDPFGKGSFKNFLVKLLTNVDAVNILINQKKDVNFKQQLITVRDNFKRYFGVDDGLSEEILSMLK